jgi:hypothetical protein
VRVYEERMGFGLEFSWVNPNPIFLLLSWTYLSTIDSCDTLPKMRSIMPTLKNKLDDNTFFRQVYTFAFKFGLMEQQKSLRTTDYCIASTS